jgi:hypothetical protein
VSDGPIRIQLSRAKGFNLQRESKRTNGLSAAKVDRTTKWGNPFVTHGDGLAMDPAMAVQSFAEFLRKEGCWSPIRMPWPKGKVPRQWTTVEKVRAELRGKNLACWCAPDAPCHADVLLRLADLPPP